MSKLQRLDKYLATLTGYSRKEISKFLKDKLILVNDNVVTDGSCKFDFATTKVSSEFIKIPQIKHQVVILLNKPLGYECSTSPDVHRSVYSLLPIEYRTTHFSIGRLDVDTTGLICFTDDGALNHFLSSPKHQHPKTYRAMLERDVCSSAQIEYIAQMKDGMLLRSEDKPTLPAKLEFIDSKTALLTIFEGKYHQVRRMFSALGNYVTQLERISFGNYNLQDLSLNTGEFKLIPIEEFKAVFGINT